MKEFEFPEVNIVSFTTVDILTTSNEFIVMPFAQIDDEFDIQPIN